MPLSPFKLLAAQLSLLLIAVPVRGLYSLALARVRWRRSSLNWQDRAPAPTMVARVVILSVGKTKEEWLNTAVDEYVKRLRASSIDLECVWVKDDAALSARAAEQPGSLVVLDERGAEYTSEAFSQVLYELLEEGGSRMTFVIGGADGLPPDLRATLAKRQMCLSRMTLTHQMARLLLVEQVYRASEIRRGSKYHRA
jgi:23S rRNA (pseudouridine1915-N3)-methyltransferase